MSKKDEINSTIIKGESSVRPSKDEGVSLDPKWVNGAMPPLPKPPVQPSKEEGFFLDPKWADADNELEHDAATPSLPEDESPKASSKEGGFLLDPEFLKKIEEANAKAPVPPASTPLSNAHELAERNNKARGGSPSAAPMAPLAQSSAPVKAAPKPPSLTERIMKYAKKHPVRFALFAGLAVAGVAMFIAGTVLTGGALAAGGAAIGGIAGLVFGSGAALGAGLIVGGGAATVAAAAGVRLGLRRMELHAEKMKLRNAVSTSYSSADIKREIQNPENNKVNKMVVEKPKAEKVINKAKNGINHTTSSVQKGVRAFNFFSAVNKVAAPVFEKTKEIAKKAKEGLDRAAHSMQEGARKIEFDFSPFKVAGESISVDWSERLKMAINEAGACAVAWDRVKFYSAPTSHTDETTVAYNMQIMKDALPKLKAFLKQEEEVIAKEELRLGGRSKKDAREFAVYKRYIQGLNQQVANMDEYLKSQPELKQKDEIELKPDITKRVR